MKESYFDIADIGGEPIDAGGLPIRDAVSFAGPWSGTEGRLRLAERLTFRLGSRSSDLNGTARDLQIQADLDRLAANVELMVEPINEHNALYWADRFQAAAVLLRQGDVQGLTDVLYCFGGMSSVNDAFYPNEDERRLSLIYELALALQGEQARLGSADQP